MEQFQHFLNISYTHAIDSTGATIDSSAETCYSFVIV